MPRLGGKLRRGKRPTGGGGGRKGTGRRGTEGGEEREGGGTKANTDEEDEEAGAERRRRTRQWYAFKTKGKVKEAPQDNMCVRSGVRFVFSSFSFSSRSSLSFLPPLRLVKRTETLVFHSQQTPPPLSFFEQKTVTTIRARAAEVSNTPRTRYPDTTCPPERTFPVAPPAHAPQHGILCAEHQFYTARSPEDLRRPG